MAAKKVTLIDPAKIGKKGGQARARKLTPEQRSEAARNAVRARWAKEKGQSS